MGVYFYLQKHQIVIRVPTLRSHIRADSFRERTMKKLRMHLKLQHKQFGSLKLVTTPCEFMAGNPTTDVM